MGSTHKTDMNNPTANALREWADGIGLTNLPLADILTEAADTIDALESSRDRAQEGHNSWKRKASQFRQEIERLRTEMSLAASQLRDGYPSQAIADDLDKVLSYNWEHPPRA